MIMLLKESTMNRILNGRWHYRSFRHEPILVKDGNVDRNPQLATPWAPLGELNANANDAGEVMGTLKFTPPGVAVKITGHITPATDKLPASVELTGEMLPTVYKIKGFFITGSDNLVGTVMSVANDLAKQPVGTAGAFVLYPAKS
jgi:hypothetical protein